MYNLFSIFILLVIDQYTRFINRYSVWYTINTDEESLQWPLIIAGFLLAILIIKFSCKYEKLYGRRPLFNCFFILLMATAASTTIDRIIFCGGRDFIPIGEYYIANLGDLYFALSFIFLTIELFINKQGKFTDLIEPLTND